MRCALYRYQLRSFLGLLLALVIPTHALASNEAMEMIATIRERSQFVSAWPEIDMHKIFLEDRRGKLRKFSGINILDVRNAMLIDKRLEHLQRSIGQGSVDIHSYLTDGHICTTNQAARQSELEKKYVKRASICAEIEGYKIAQMIWPQASVFLDIGCNRGFISALFFSLWGGGGYNISPLTLFDTYAQYGMFPNNPNPSGFCKTGFNRGFPLYCSSPEMRETSGKCNDKNKDFKVYAIDGSSYLVDSMREKLIKTYLAPAHPEVRVDDVWRVFHLAMADKEGFVEFTMQNDTLQPGFEGGGITLEERKVKESKSKNGIMPTEIVRTSTITKFAAEQGITKRIDMIKIDAEGFDIPVIVGALPILEEAKVGMITFEKPKWAAPGAFDQLMEDLEKLHFDCYTPHFVGMLKLTGQCYRSVGIARGGNIFCASRKYAPGVVLAYDALSLYHEDQFYETYADFERLS